MYFRYFLVVLFCTSNIAKSQNHGINNEFASTLRPISENDSDDSDTASVEPLPISRQSACPSKSTLVIINNLGKGSIHTIPMENLDTLNLSKVREMLIAREYMDDTDHFFNNFKSSMLSTIHKHSEPEIYVCEIMKVVENNQYLLYLGHKILYPQQEVANKYLYGIILDKNGNFKVSNEITNKIAMLDDNNFPIIEKIGKLEVVNTLSSTTESNENEKTFAVSASIHASVNYGVVQGSASVNGEFSNATDSKQENESVHITTRILNLKERIVLDEHKIISSDWFKKRVFSIMKSDGGMRVVGAKLIEFLNKYGWYFPVDYVVGGALSKSTVRSKTTVEEALKVAESIGTELTAKIGSFGEGSVEAHYSGSLNTKHRFMNESSQDILTSFGAGGALNIEEFQQKIENNKNWIVLQYKKLIPSLRLLYNNYPYQFGQIHRLFLNMYTINSLTKLQPFINYRNYASELESYPEHETENVY